MYKDGDIQQLLLGLTDARAVRLFKHTVYEGMMVEDERRRLDGGAKERNKRENGWHSL